MAKDVDDDSTVVFLAVVPGGALQFLEFSGEHPEADLSPRTERIFPKKPVSMR